MNAETLRGEQRVGMRYLEVPYEQHANVAWCQVPFPCLKKLMNVSKELKERMDEVITFIQSPKAFKAGAFENDIHPRCRKAMNELETVFEKCKF
jgi:hypothetical protein